MRKFFLKSTLVISVCLMTLGGCAHRKALSEDPNQDIKKTTHTAFIPIAIGLAGLAIAFVAGSAGFSHEEANNQLTIQ